MPAVRPRLSKALLAALLLAASAQSVAAQKGAAEPSWTKLADIGFSALFPVEPQPLTYADPQKTRPDSYLALVGGGVYFVAALTHPGTGIAASDPFLRQRLFDGIQRGALAKWKKRLNANFIYQRDVSLGAHRGREFSVESPRYAGVLRMYLTPKRFYAVAFFHRGDVPLSHESERFLGSFEITEP